MVIKFDQVHVIEHYEEIVESTGKSYAEKKYSKVLIKLTRSPTDDDKKEAGYNAGFSSENITD